MRKWYNIDGIEIKYDKSKLLISLLPTIIGVAIGLLFYNYINYFSFSDPVIIKIIVIFIVTLNLFMGLSYYICLLRFFMEQPAIILNNKGIYDYTGIVNFGLIKWTDVSNISIKPVKDLNLYEEYDFNKLMKQSKSKFLLIFLKDNNKYLKHSNLLIRFSASNLMNFYYTPVLININIIDNETFDLYVVIKRYLKSQNATSS